MTRITNNLTESRVSTLGGESASENADNLWFPMLKHCHNLIWIEYILRKIGSKPKCCLDNKGVPISTNPIQTTSEPIKPREC